MRRMRIYSSLNLKYDAIIEDYLRNGKKMNIKLVKKYINKHEINDLMNEMRMIGLELNEEEKEEIRVFKHQILEGFIHSIGWPI